MSKIPTPPATWASAANFTAGASPWSGQPNKVSPPGLLWTPNTPIAAEYRNWLDNALTSATKSAYDLAITGAVSNWDTQVGIGSTLGSGTQGMALRWHPWRQCWIFAYATSSNVLHVTNTVDNGRNLTGEPPTGTAVRAVTLWTDPASPDYLVFATGVFFTATGASVVGSGTTLVNVNTPGVFIPQGSGFGFIGYAGYSTFGCVYQQSASYGGSWADATSTLPSAWQTNTLPTPDSTMGLLSATSDSTDTSGPRTLIGIAGATVGTTASRMLVIDNTQAFHDLGVATPITGTPTRTLRGLCYSPNDALFGALASDNVNTYLYTTPDPVTGTWTLVHTFTGLPDASGLAVVGQTWTVSLRSSGTFGRLMHSSNVGSSGAASTWSTSNGTVQATTGCLVSSGNQLAAFSSIYYSFSKTVGPQGQGLY